jgi:dephospho-CoA kinase
VKAFPFSEKFSICLTGGIATGKSRVGDWLSKNGWKVICTDEIVHQLYQPGQPLVKEIIREFGVGVESSSGGINRKALGEIVFRETSARNRLNALVHPCVRREWKRLARISIEAKNPTMVVIPLAYETGVDKEFSEVWVVACTEARQMERLQSRGLDEASARRRISAQWPLQKKIDLADRVLWNQNSWELTEEQLQISNSMRQASVSAAGTSHGCV